MPDATRLVVAQRVSTIRDADQIIVLDHGEIVGIGRHDNSLETSETYREIVESQRAWRRHHERPEEHPTGSLGTGAGASTDAWTDGRPRPDGRCGSRSEGAELRSRSAKRLLGTLRQDAPVIVLASC